MSEIREPLWSERTERLFALEQLHQIGVLDRDELRAATTAAEIVEVREAPIQSDRLLNGRRLDLQRQHGSLASSTSEPVCWGSHTLALPAVSERLPRGYDDSAHRARQLPGRLRALLALVGTFPPLGGRR
jgi:hypothetical protein